MQVRELARQSGMRLDRTERVANSLGHLAGVLSQLSSLDTTGIKVASGTEYAEHPEQHLM